MLNPLITTDAWADAAFSAFSALVNCEIEIYLPGKATYNSTTGKNVPGAETSVWEGPARVQTINMAERDAVDAYDRQVQRYQFQIPRGSAVLDDKMQVRVTQGGLNPANENNTYYIREVFNSGGAFELTFFATENSAR